MINTSKLYKGCIKRKFDCFNTSPLVQELGYNKYKNIRKIKEFSFDNHIQVV